MAKAFADLAVNDRILLQGIFYRAQLTAIAHHTNLRSGEQVRKQYRLLWRRDLDPQGILDGLCRSWLLRLWIEKKKDLPQLVQEGLPDEKFPGVSQGTRAKTHLFLAWFKQAYQRKGNV